MPSGIRSKFTVLVALVFVVIPFFGIWVYFHLGSISLICNCVPGDLFPKWASESSVIGGVFTLLPILFADWYLWTRWRSYRREKVLAKTYRAKHEPWYAKTGSERPTGPIKNKPYEE